MSKNRNTKSVSTEEMKEEIMFSGPNAVNKISEPDYVCYGHDTNFNAEEAKAELDLREMMFVEKFRKADLIMSILRELDSNNEPLITGGDRQRLIEELINIPFDILEDE